MAVDAAAMGAEGAGLSQSAGRAAEIEQGVAAGKPLGQLRKKPAVSQAASPAPAATGTGTDAGSSSSGSDGWSVPLPDVSSFAIPGDGIGEKALLVLMVLILGLGVYSRVTGKSALLGLWGPSAGQPAPVNPNNVGSPNSANTIAQRQAAANPAKSS